MTVTAPGALARIEEIRARFEPTPTPTAAAPSSAAIAAPTGGSDFYSLLMSAAGRPTGTMFAPAAAPAADLLTLLQIVGDASAAQVTATVLAPLRFSLFTGIEPGTNRGYIQIANVGQMRAYVQAVMGN